MSDFRHVLFPVDFSQPCTAVVGAVAAFRERFDTKLTVLHSLEVSQDVAWVLDSQVSGKAASLVHGVRQRLENYLADSLPASATRVTLIGKPAKNIVSFASREGCDLIMMPTHGCSGFRKLLLGSVTATVLHDTESAVWTTAHTEMISPREQCDSVLCAVDLGKNAVSILRRAKQIAERWHAKLGVVHAVPAVDPRFASAVADRAHEFLVISARQRYPELAAQAGLGAELDIVEELKLGPCMAEACRRHDADLLVIGRGAIQGALGRLRANAHEIIRSAPCPVLSL